VALLQLTRERPELAKRWLEIRTPRDGHAFFTDTQQHVKRIIGKIGLSGVYEAGSSAAQHMRLASMVFGMQRIKNTVSLRDQEVDPEEPFNYCLRVSHFHTAQLRVLSAVRDGFPDVKLPGWATALRNFHERSRIVAEQLRIQFPEAVIELEEHRGASTTE
jgi:hypothetical protein